MKVLFVGDKPSRLNTNPGVAFIGTPSYRNLCKWIAKMQIPDFTMVNSNDRNVLLPAVYGCHRDNMGVHCVVALGNVASKRLDLLAIKHFKLPHPSPLNRQLNNEYFIDEKLYECYRYLMENYSHVHYLQRP